YVMDEGFRRAVPDPATASRWHLDLSKVKELPLAEVDALPLGPPLRSRPFLVQGSGPAIYAVDDLLPFVPLEGVAVIPGGPVTPAPKPRAPAGEMTAYGGCSAAPGGLLGLMVWLWAARRRRVRPCAAPF
ncbi:MAG: putative exported peptidase, partial [Myxococcaceae bacterium]|nr:putative exported peptidase [Myxococcaceae bacterium]